MAANPLERPWPVEIRLAKQRAELFVTWDDGFSHLFRAEFLRVQSPSAEVQGHGPGQKVTVAGKRSVTILGVEPVGAYAVKLIFSDGHDTGIYTWDVLRGLAHDQPGLWQAYLDDLEAKGLSRGD